MKKKILSLIVTAALCLGVMGCGESSAEEVQQGENTELDTADGTQDEERAETAEPDEKELTEYSNEFFSIAYNEDLFTLDDKGESLGLYTKLDDGGGHNTLLGILVHDNNEFDSILESEIRELNELVCQMICQNMYEVDDGVEIIKESYDSKIGYCMELSDGSKCYTRVMSYGRQIALATCRLCPYSEEVNDKLYETYLTAESLVESSVDLEEIENQQNTLDEYPDIQKKLDDILEKYMPEGGRLEGVESNPQFVFKSSNVKNGYVNCVYEGGEGVELSISYKIDTNELKMIMIGEPSESTEESLNEFVNTIVEIMYIPDFDVDVDDFVNIVTAMIKDGTHEEQIGNWKVRWVNMFGNQLQIIREDGEVLNQDEVSAVKTYTGGMYKIGTDMPAGEYLITLSGRAYIEVTSDSSGSLESIVSNDISANRKYITVDEGQYLKFEGTAVPAEEAPAFTAKDVYPEGMYLVGKDIPAGEYKISPINGKGYIEIASDSYGTLESIISNDNFESEIYRTVSDGQYLKLSGAEIKME